MTPEETAHALNNLAKLIAEQTPDMAQGAALTAKALIQERIQESGQDAIGAELTPYSESYRKLRNKKGYETAFTNVTFTGQMWRATNISSTTFEGSKYVVEIGGTDTPSKDKLNWNSERYGDLLRLSKNEENKLQTKIDDTLIDLVKKSGL